MEKLDGTVALTWASRQISTYKIKHEGGRPHGCHTETDRVYTQICGPGWRFGIGYDDLNGFVNIYFDPFAVADKVKNLDVTVMLKESPSKEQCFRRLKVVGLSSSRESELLSFKPSEIILHPIISFMVNFSANGDLPLPQVAPPATPSIRKMLSASIRGEDFIDTKFILYSRRCMPSGRVEGSRAVFANSAALKEESSYFQTLLSNNGFTEAIVKDLESTPPGTAERFSFTDEYDYASDSDLDEIEDTAVNGSSKETKSMDKLNDDVGDQLSMAKSTGGDAPPNRLGRTVIVKDVAFTTWNALIMYLYTGSIEFSFLRSDQRRSEAGQSGPDELLCSPKSMYRLAEKIGLESLQELSRQAILSRLTEDNVVHEVFSEFTSRYKEIQETEVDFLCKHLESPAVRSALSNKLKEVVAGEMPHSLDVLSYLVEKQVNTR